MPKKIDLGFSKGNKSIQKRDQKVTGDQCQILTEKTIITQNKDTPNQQFLLTMQGMSVKP